MMLQTSSYEPRKTFQSYNNDFVSKTQFKQHATQTVHYQVNGTGRDTYINRDNGGFCKMYEPYPYKYGSVGTFGSKRQYCQPAPTMHPMGVFYRSDGTGRDSYVIQTNGGLTNTGRLLNYKDAFKRSLRQYDDPRTTSCYPYVKLGGRTAGFEKAKSTNTFQHYKNNDKTRSQIFNNTNTFDNNNDTQGTEESPVHKNHMSFTSSSGFHHQRRDILLEAQLTYDHKFHRAQHEMRKVQKSMDARLSRPKYSRQQSMNSNNNAANKSQIIGRPHQMPQLNRTIQH